MKKYFIGIDFSKEKFDVTLLSREEGKSPVVKSHEVFTNGKSGYAACVRRIKSETGKAPSDELLFCGEDTGRYSDAFACYLYGLGYDLWLESPLQIKRSMGIQRIKNDKADSAFIAEYAMRHEDKAKYYKSPSGSLLALRELFNYRLQLVKERKAQFVRANEIKHTSCRKSEAISFILRSSSKLVKKYDEDIAKCDELIKELIESDQELAETYRIVTSIKGVGQQNATALILCTDNFTRFNDARQLACYCGVAPFAKESGSSIHSPAHTSPLANKQMKALISEAAVSASAYNPVIKTYYERFINRGKPKGVALNNVKNKLLHIIMAMVRNKTMFDAKYVYASTEEYRKNIA